ncbi:MULTISPECIES: hypothetical protein [unclassified Wolbachia]|nr:MULTISPECIES: hypothetical protein [unclassified Wolbachia]MDX5487808.1 hypothetical protein [Wolbachia endosymbiont of Andrena praecox]MDX5496225.1 hypothetical protein [Wolbachia endosymbiont of Nomada fabriciana]MDX5526285.1 hypothetical protein [Wolbachia endosymbiont of Andrena nigroaenea]MDX5543251.1 hypothetical protein [Wolbachia endosymbiont of Andrena apicata]MEC4734426.1 hypothetical protein [Wolbachia endosymbiont of Halictus tumulorum]
MEKLQKIIRAIKGVSIANFVSLQAVSSKDLEKIKSLVESG